MINGGVIMNEVKVNVRFTTGIIYKTSTKLVMNDYNSTKLIFDFDILCYQ